MLEVQLVTLTMGASGEGALMTTRLAPPLMWAVACACKGKVASGVELQVYMSLNRTHLLMRAVACSCKAVGRLARPELSAQRGVRSLDGAVGTIPNWRRGLQMLHVHGIAPWRCQ